MSEYIEFVIKNTKRLKDLQKVSNKLKSDKDEENIQDYKEYLALLDEEAREYFIWSTPEEDVMWAERWFATQLRLALQTHHYNADGILDQ